ncbi:aminoglycoside phosphotransferase family protein [uncultured Friedmanniella sp.]|uniref:aminoglycoside phosphotransferase family protein n=1 Tax=uncultured Friedmanniella sp. TaxID=335381 RepID=UPI0035CC4974
MTLDLPAEFLGHARRSPEWARWLDALPRLIRDLCAEWRLTDEGPPATGENAVVLPVRNSLGEPAALKVGWPHPEARYEHLALRAWDGDGAVQLLRADPHRFALLLERADPGHDLHALGVVEACEVVAGLYGRLHRPPLPQLGRLSVHAARWADELVDLRDGALAPRRFVDQAIGLCTDLAADSGTDVALLHGDLHYANVLAGTREPWLAIDPHPLAGDPAYEVAPLLWNRWTEAVASGDLRGALLERLYTVVDAAGLDEDRVRDWVTVREMVNVLWASHDAQLDRDWVTRCTTVVKAVQR